MSQIQVKKLSEKEKKDLAIPFSPKAQGPWSVWECPPSTFEWHYDKDEKAYLYEGRVKVKTPHSEVELKAGDFVFFPKGLSCTWEVIEPVRKVYRFE